MKKSFASLTILLLIINSACTKTNFQPSSTINAISDESLLTAGVQTGILTGSRTGFYLLNAANGGTIWNYSPGGTNGVCSSTACVYGTNVLFNLGDTLYSAAVRTGTKQWSVYFKHFRSAICIANNKAYISSRIAINCINPANGALIWKMSYGFQHHEIKLLHLCCQWYCICGWWK